VEEFSVVENLAVLEVVSLGVTEALFEVVLDSNEGWVFARVQLRLYLVESDGLLDDGVIIGVRAFVGGTKKIE
jgi:hypothetical protein